MNVEISNDLVDRVINLLPKEAADLGREEVIKRVLEALAESMHGLSSGELAQILKPKLDGREPQSALASASELGLVGAFEGPEDLSTNRQHMNGFGQ